MPTIFNCKNAYGDIISPAKMTEDKQEENCISLLNEVKIIKNAQELNELITTKEHKNSTLFSNHQPVKKNDESVVGGISKFFTLKRILGLISSVTGALFLWQAGRNIYYKDNRACLSIANSIDLLNTTSMGDTQNVTALTSNILPLNLYRDESPFYNNRLCDDENLSLHEYLKEIEIINNLSLPNVDRLYRIILSIDHKRITRAITTPPDYQVNVSGVMSNILNNDDIDWRIREEFRGVYHRAMNSSEVNQARDGIEKNVKLILSTVSLMLQYLHKNRMENLSKVSFIYGIAFIESFLSILDEMEAFKSGTIDKRYKKTVALLIRDIYSNKKNQSYDCSLYTLNVDDGYDEKPLGSKRAFFLSEVRNAIIYKNDMTTISPELKEDDVKVVNLALCQIQREDFTFVNALRTLSQTIKSPLVNLIKETRIVYEYSIKDNGCPAPIPPEMEGFMEKVTESLGEIMSWLPYYNRVRLVSLIAASVINMIADAIENKELSLSSAIEVNDYMLSLTKDIISSLSTKQMKDMDSVRADAKIKKMMKNIKYKKIS